MLWSSKSFGPRCLIPHKKLKEEKRLGKVWKKQEKRKDPYSRPRKKLKQRKSYSFESSSFAFFLISSLHLKTHVLRYSFFWSFLFSLPFCLMKWWHALKIMIIKGSGMVNNDGNGENREKEDMMIVVRSLSLALKERKFKIFCALSLSLFCQMRERRKREVFKTQGPSTIK